MCREIPHNPEGVSENPVDAFTEDCNPFRVMDFLQDVIPGWPC